MLPRLALVTLLSLAGTTAGAQTLTGQIAGHVIDQAKAPVYGATITVTNTRTFEVRGASTDERGNFAAPVLLPGTYDLTVAADTFKTFEWKAIVVHAMARVSLPAIAMQPGPAEERVSISGTPLLTDVITGDRAFTIPAAQIEDQPLRGRDVLGTLATVPGVIDTAVRDLPGAQSAQGLTINGQTTFDLRYDGVLTKDTTSNTGNYVVPPIDAVADVRVQTSNPQAEYGHAPGAAVTLVTKSGSQSIHGSVGYFKRDDSLNSNSWERERLCAAGQSASCDPAPYRFDNTAWTFSGPVRLPWLGVNKSNHKLFFFFSQDLLRHTEPGDVQYSTMPTALERAGDFSQTRNAAGQLRFIKDPELAAQGLACNVNTGGPGCFAGNVIPQDRLDPIGRMMLNLFPLPNAVDPTGARAYNYTFQDSIERPKNNQSLRLDWNARPGTRLYGRVQFGNEVVARGGNTRFGAGTGDGGDLGWPLLPTSYHVRTIGVSGTLLHAFKSSAIVELSMGTNWAHQLVEAQSGDALARLTRSRALPGLTQFAPSANPRDLIPNMTFAGDNALPNTRAIALSDRFPFDGTQALAEYNFSLTKVWREHTFKGGAYLITSSRTARQPAVFNGAFSFDANTANPLDTNFGFANALLGSVNEYTESNAQFTADGRYTQLEYYGQDTWRLTPRLTIDGGARLYHLGPTRAQNLQLSYFDPRQWSSSLANQLYPAACANGAAVCSGSQRVARDPLSGDLVNPTYIGRLVNGTGDGGNGLAAAQDTVYSTEFKTAPRANAAFDLTRDGRTSLRGGFGMYYDRYPDDLIVPLVQQRPAADTLVTNFTTIAALQQAQLFQSPVDVEGFGPFHVPTIYAWSAGVQRVLPWKFVADVAYVASATRHLPVMRNINGVPLGTTRVDLNPQNADPTKNNTQAKDIDFLRSYRGLGDIDIVEWTGYANQRGVEASLRRQLTNGLSFTVAYTGMKREALTEVDEFLSDDANRARHYRRTGRPHSIVVAYDYLLPGAGAKGLAAAALGGWQVSGVTTIQSGVRSGFTYAFTGAPYSDMTGNESEMRVVLTCDPNLPRGDRTVDRQFRTDCVKPGGGAGDPFYLGTAKNDEYVAPGYVNHDVAIFKNFATPRGSRLQVRIELYNAFNSLQVGAVDTHAVFDFATGQQTNPQFGKVIASRSGSARVIQIGARFVF